MERLILILMLVMVVSGCKSVKRSQSQKTEARTEKRETRDENRETRTERIIYGDTLKAIVPIRVPSRTPQIIRGESKGLDLEITVTDSTVKYKAIAKPVATEIVEETTATKIKSNEETDTTSEKEESKEVSIMVIPWYMWLVSLAFVAVIVGMIVKRIKDLLKPF